MLAQITLIVWRESVEALLVVGILHAWLAHNGARTGLRFLWGGVAAGILAAVALSVLLVRFAASLPPEGQEYFQAFLIFFACILIVQMVLWMRRHGRRMKQDLESGLASSAQSGRWWGVFAIAALAIAREGSEAVIFLQGMIAAAGAGGFLDIAGGTALALAAAAATYGLLQFGGRFLSWPLFFLITEAMLLCLACALLVTGIGYLVSFGYLPYTDPVWDSSAVLDDAARFGGFVAALTGYRAQPDIVTIATWLVYWSAIAALLRIQARPRRQGELAAS
ncbi:MAG TPA: FTR1 family protein [Hyphomicrobiales bacterium]|nr:FTR1 family protein [Rhodobiaceae bacterium]HXK54335.1 FTR1 family protein [Hyphomicrobiales bacterium]